MNPPAGRLRLASPAIINFTMGLLSAVAELFPSTLFGTGGDEINIQFYADDAQTQSDLSGRTLNQALDAFTQATHGALRKLGKTPVVWEGASYLRFEPPCDCGTPNAGFCCEQKWFLTII